MKSFGGVLYSVSFVSSKENPRENPDEYTWKIPPTVLLTLLSMRQNNKVQRLI